MRARTALREPWRVIARATRPEVTTSPAVPRNAAPALVSLYFCHPRPEKAYSARESLKTRRNCCRKSSTEQARRSRVLRPRLVELVGRVAMLGVELFLAGISSLVLAMDPASAAGQYLDERA